MRWLALHLPDLATELFTRGRDDAVPLLVAAADGPRRRVHACNRTAAECGIAPGMGVAAAQALSRRVQVRARDPRRERAELEGLAAWAGQFTSTVSLLPGSGLLLEVAGSLRLFHGPAPLLERVLAGTAELGYNARAAIAPTPLGAQALAQSGAAAIVETLDALEAQLAPFPLQQLGLPDESVDALTGMGLRRLGDCLRLPRAGLARRLGPALLEHLDRLLGRRPDPRPPFAPPARFERRLLLPGEVEQSEALLFAARRLLLELAGALRARGAGVREMVLELDHRAAPTSRLRIGLVAPSRDAEHLQRLLRSQLERFELPAPVEEIALNAEALEPLAATHPDLFDADDSATGDWRQLVEQLRARLGPDAVFGCRPTADHRPERAWQAAAPGERAAAVATPPRPLWLLPEPQALEEIGGRPCRGGALRLLAGPERIESGWWDGGVVERDYFVAEDGRHARLWIFRELRGGRRWFLHGLFA